MKKRLPFSQFSEPQAVLFLLAWLRLITTGLLLFFCGLAEVIHIKAIQQLLNWPIIIVCSALLFTLSALTQLLKHKEINQYHLLAILLIDIVCWTALVFASGASINPAISYLLVLLSIAALSLSGKQATILTLITVMLYAWMMGTQPQTHHGHMMGWHLWGMWVLFMLNAVIMLVVIALLSRALREKDKAIAAYREDTVRNEQLVSLGTMAANIAHELGTPLSTISILVSDMEHEDTAIIQQQIERCKNALAQLKTGALNINETSECGSKNFLERLVHEVMLLQPQANIEWQDKIECQLKVSPLFEQSLLALINNAIEAADQKIEISLYQKQQFLVFDILHDGDKVSEELLKVLGRQAVESGKNGLGLGYYLANATIERLGGRLQIVNQTPGVLTRVEFPLQEVMA
jgi:two-component system, sensor histidine kinase RegB